MLASLQRRAGAAATGRRRWHTVTTTPEPPVRHSLHRACRRPLHLPAGNSSSDSNSAARPRAGTRPTALVPPGRAVQVRRHGGHGHGHGHAHSHESNLLLLGDRTDPGVRITRLGLATNLLMALSKGVGGYVFHSQALTADAVHSLTDLVSDVMTLSTISLAMKPPTRQFPNGFGRVETIGALGVSGILLAGGALMGWSAIMDLAQIYSPTLVDAFEYIGLAHGHGHHHHHIPNIQAAWLAGGSVLVKEWLYHATMKVARAKKSTVLESNAVHHRVDSLTAIAALASIGASNLFPAVLGIDAVGSLLITYMVVRTGWANSRSALVELAGKGIPDEAEAEVRAEAEAAVADRPARVVAVRGTRAGQSMLVDVAVRVRPDLTVAACNELERAIRARVGSRIEGVRRVSCRFLAEEEEEERAGRGGGSGGSGGSGDGFADELVQRERRPAAR